MYYCQSFIIRNGGLKRKKEYLAFEQKSQFFENLSLVKDFSKGCRVKLGKRLNTRDFSDDIRETEYSRMIFGRRSYTRAENAT